MLLKDDSRIAAAQATRREGNISSSTARSTRPAPCAARQRRPAVADQGAPGRARRAGGDGHLPRRAAGNVRGADRLHALAAHAGTRGQAAVRLADANLRQHLRARPTGAGALLLRPGSELRLHHRANLHPERGHRADRRVSPAAPNGYTQLAGAVTYAAEDESDRTAKKGKGFRGYFRGIGGYGVSDHSSAGYDVYLSSDNTFLDRYQFDDADVLRSRVYLEGPGGPEFLVAERLLLPGPRPVYDQDTIPVALPLAETRLVSDRMRWGSYFTADSNVLALTRNQGLDTRRISNRVGWTLPSVGPIGDVYGGRRQPARRRLQHRRRPADLRAPRAAEEPKLGCCRASPPTGAGRSRT